MAEGTRSQDNKRLEENLKTLLRDQKEQFDREIAALKNLILDVNTQRVSSNPDSPNSENQESHLSRGYQMATRLSRVEFPRFSGGDFKGWLYKCEQFFEIDDNPSNAKVRLAAIHMEGKALQWHQVFMKSRFTRDMPSWEEYVKAIAARFGNTLYDDPMGDLKRLRQKGNVGEYQEQFEELLNRVNLSEEYAVSCFLSGLKEDIQTGVRMFMPRTVQHAVGLAKLEESKITSNGKGTQRAGNFQGSALRPSIPPIFVSAGSPYGRSFARNSTSLLPTPRETQGSSIRKSARTLSSAELDEIRAKGLCFWCDERFERGHVCKKKHLYRIEVIEEEEEEGMKRGEEILEDIEKGQLAHISVCAMTSTLRPNFRTMRITGHVGTRTVSIFIDCGSSHNFVHPNVVKDLGLRVKEVNPLAVEVADGGYIVSPLFTCFIEEVEDLRQLLHGEWR